MRARRWAKTAAAVLVGGLFLGSTLVGMFCVCMIGSEIGHLQRHQHHRERLSLGPSISGEERYDSADPTKTAWPPKIAAAFEAPFERFVTRPSAAHARSAGAPSIDPIMDPRSRDATFFSYTKAAVERHLASRSFFVRLDDVRHEYAQVLGALRQTDLPEVLAAVPFAMSGLRSDLQSPYCAKGAYRLLPEQAERARRHYGVDIVVEDCEIRHPDGAISQWTPTDVTPPSPIRANAAYLDGRPREAPADPSMCLIPPVAGCRIDGRSDLKTSTEAAIALLSAAWSDRELARSGAGVALTILSFEAGYDDAAFGAPRRWNIRPAFEQWRQREPGAAPHRFYGDNIRCEEPSSPTFCGAVLAPSTQHFGYTVVAQHTLAACYYGANYAQEIQEFRHWRELFMGFCDALEIPTADQVQGFR